MANAILSALYLRASTDEQTESIDAQRLLLERYAADNGLKIATEYEDFGHSGDSFQQRLGLQQLLADARQGKFKAVLVRDLSRLSRRNSLRTAKQIIGPLLDYNCAVYTAMQGDLRIDSSTGRIILAILSEMDHAENVKRALNVVNGQLKAALAGSWIGAPPYAYRIEGGKHNKRLVLDDPEQQRIVKWIFAQYDAGVSSMAIAKQLNADGIPSARGCAWNHDTISGLLRRPVYCGDYRFNFRSCGKYYQTQDGKPVARAGHWLDEDCEKAARQINGEAEWIVHRNHWPALVDRQLWDRVQRRLDKCHRSKPPVEHFLFSSLLRCTTCKQTLWGTTRKDVQHYYCEGCRATVGEPQLLQEVGRAIKRQAGADQIAKLRQAIERKLKQPAPKRSNKAALQKQIAKQERKLVLLDPEPELLRPVQDELRRLRAELQRQEREQRAAATPTADVQQRIDRALADFFRLPDLLAAKDRQAVRRLLQNTIEQIDLDIQLLRQGKHRRYQLQGGNIFAYSGVGPQGNFCL